MFWKKNFLFKNSTDVSKEFKILKSMLRLQKIASFRELNDKYITGVCTLFNRFKCLKKEDEFVVILFEKKLLIHTFRSTNAVLV